MTLHTADSPRLFFKDQSLVPYCPLIRARNNMRGSLGSLTYTRNGKSHMKQVNKELADSKMVSPVFSPGNVKVRCCCSIGGILPTQRGVSSVGPYSNELISSPKMLLLNFWFFLKKEGPFSGHTHFDFCLEAIGRGLEDD